MNHQTSRSHDPSSFTLKLEDFKPPELDFLIKHELHLRRGWAAICVADTPLQMLHHLGNIAPFIKMLTCLQINMSTEFVKVTLTYIRNNYKLFNWDGDSVRGGGGQVHVTFFPHYFVSLCWGTPTPPHGDGSYRFTWMHQFPARVSFRSLDLQS